MKLSLHVLSSNMPLETSWSEVRQPWGKNLHPHEKAVINMLRKAAMHKDECGILM